MPQVYNKSLARSIDGSAFAKTSRFMSVNQSSMETTKRLHARYKVEKKFREHHLAIAERHKNIQTAQADRIVQKLSESLKRTLAYKNVIEKKTFSKIPDKGERLNTNYTMYALRFDIAEQLKKLDPGAIREKQAQRKVDMAKNECDKVIKRNLRTILSPRTRYRKKLRQQLQLEAEDSWIHSTAAPSPKPISRLSTQKSIGHIVSKSFMKSKRNKNTLDSTEEESPDKTLKLPPIKPNKGLLAPDNNLLTPEKKTGGARKSSPLPDIASSRQSKKSVEKKKNLTLNSQKPSLPAIKITQ